MGKLHDLRIVSLAPMRVAYYCAQDESPERKAMEVLGAWAKPNKILNIPGARIYGFNNPGPTKDNPVYGYEVWVTVGADVKESGDIKIKESPGGFYAVIRTKLPQIGQSWKDLINWCKASGDYVEREGQCLEEHISPVGTPFENCIIDLYLPVAAGKRAL